MQIKAIASVYNTTTLVHGLLSDAPLAEPFFVHKPFAQGSFVQRASVVDNYYRTDRKKLSQALMKYNQTLGASKAALNNILLLENPATLVVVTGQQAGILSGPLYTIYKAVTTIQLARQQSQLLGRPVVPLFWVASEDHDYAEINHSYAFNHKAKVEKLTLPCVPTGTPAAGQISLGPWADAFIEMYLATVQGEFAAEVGTLLKETKAKASTLAEWFACIMTLLFSEYGLVMVDPMLPDLRSLLGDFFCQAVQVNDQISTNVLESAQAIADAGYQVPIQWRSGNTGLYLLTEGQRLAIQKMDNQFTVRAVEPYWAVDDLQRYIRKQPECFSTNVVLRPIAQDTLLPTLAYVGGPGEISYYGQLKEVYPLFGLEMPIVYPRLSVTILEQGDREFLDKYGLGYEDLGELGEKKLISQIEGVAPIELDQVMDEAKGAIEEIHSQLVRQLAKIDPALEFLAQDNLERITYQINYLDKKAKQRLRKQHRLLLNQYQSLANRLRPLGKPQERIYPVFEVMSKHGLIWLQALLQEDFTDVKSKHWLIELE